MAQASPVGPAPITSTSVCISGRKLTLVLGSTSSSSAARNWGMDQDGGTRWTGSRATRKPMILARGNLVTIGRTTDLRAQARSRHRDRPNFPFDDTQPFVLSNFQIVSGLQIEPKTSAGIEIAGQAQRRIRRNGATLVNNLRNPSNRDTEVECEAIHAQLKGFHELGAQNFARVNGRKKCLRFRHILTLTYQL